jgi:hypothetical protein
VSIVTTDRLTCWRSSANGPWCEITVAPRSIIGLFLRSATAGAVYDDGYGNRYTIDPEVAR